MQDQVTPAELAGWIEERKPVTVIDVRSSGEYAAAHVPGAIHIPFTHALGRADELRDRPRPFVVYCGHGPRASLARLAWRLVGIGDVLSLSGHYAAWQSANLPTE